MQIPAQLLFMGSLLIASVAQAQIPSIKPQDADLTNFQYPYPVQFITLNIQGETLKMAYMDVKPVNANGHVVMLLHGKNFNGAYWRQTAAVLAENGYRVIVPDQVGFGKSSKPRHMQPLLPLNQPLVPVGFSSTRPFTPFQKSNTVESFVAPILKRLR